MSTVKMIQYTNSKWKIVATVSGALLQDDIKACDTPAAVSYVRNYITSFSGWSYEIIPLPRKK